jgi:hypothetical protein
MQPPEKAIHTKCSEYSGSGSSWTSMARPMAMVIATMPSMRSVLLSLAGVSCQRGLGRRRAGANPFSELQPAAMTTTGRRAAVGGPPLPPPDVTNAESISGQSMPSGLALQWATMACPTRCRTRPIAFVPFVLRILTGKVARYPVLVLLIAE